MSEFVELHGASPSAESPANPPSSDDPPVGTESALIEAAGQIEEPAPQDTPSQHTPAEQKPSQDSHRLVESAPLIGSIIRAADDDVFIDLGNGQEAVVAAGEFNGRKVIPGTTVRVIVDDASPTAGAVRARLKKGPDVHIPGIPQVGETIEVTVSGLIKGGLEVILPNDIRGFLPASQVSSRRIRDISIFLSQSIRCEVIEVDPAAGNIVVSRKNAVEKERKTAQQELLAGLAPGQDLDGTVVGLSEYGAFVDLNGLRGLVHVSDMSWVPIDKPDDLVHVGDKIKVRVLRVNSEKKRISLGMKQLTPDPWADVGDRFPEGTRAKAKIVKLADFGAFAELAEGIVGLIPLSEMSWSHRPARAEEVVEVGGEVDLVVLQLDRRRRRISLSMRQITEDPWKGIEETVTRGSIVTGRVTKLLDFGVLVELKPDVEGMIHISELSDRRVGAPSDVVTVGQEVQVKVLSLDPTKRRIGLSIKATIAPQERAASAVATGPAKPKRKRRGGLESHFEW